MAPEDRKAPARQTAAEQKKANQAVAEFMATGIDLTPFTIDAGDGIEWAFRPDPMPVDIERIQVALKAVKTAVEQSEGADAAGDLLIEAIRSMMIDPKQKAKFPQPMYGFTALTFFAMHLQVGKTGLPTAPA